MPSFSHIFSPDVPENQNSNFQEGTISGWVPAVITSLVDDQKLGRVRISVDLFERGTDIPNQEDGYCWVGEEFTVNSGLGGAHRFLQGGTLIAALPMMGQPNQFLLLACINNKVDPPHPEFDRAKRTYGSATPGQVFTIKNDTSASRTDSYPHGVLQNVSGDGNLTNQTRDHARMQLRQDGTSRLENDNSFTMHSPEGTVSQRSADGAQQVLHSDGRVEMNSASGALLHLFDGEAQMSGPANQISALIADVKSLVGGHLGEGGALFSQISKLSKNLLAGGDFASFLNAASGALDGLDQGLLKNINPGSAALSKLTGLSFDELGTAVMPQIQKALKTGLSDVVPGLESFLQSAPNFLPETISGKLAEILPAGMLKGLNLSSLGADLSPLLQALTGDPGMQLQNILDQVMPKGWKSIENVLGMNLQGAIGGIDEILNKEPPTLESLLAEGLIVAETVISRELEDVVELATPENLEILRQEIEKFFKLGVSQLTELIPGNLSGLVSELNLKDLLQMEQGISGAGRMQNLVGRFSQGLLSKASGTIANLAPSLDKIKPVMGLAKDLLNYQKTATDEGRLRIVENLLSMAGDSEFSQFINLDAANLLQHAQDQVLPKMLSTFSDRIQGLLGPTVDDLNKAINAVPQGGSGSTVLATNLIAQISTPLQAAGSMLEVRPDASELLSPFRLNRVFAQAGKAGIATPFGGMSVSTAGLSGGLDAISGIASVGMRVAEKAMRSEDGQSFKSEGKSSGMGAHSEDGAAVGSFYRSDWDFDDPKVKWKNQSAEIRAKHRIATITTFDPDETPEYQIRVDQKGIKFNPALAGKSKAVFSEDAIELSNAARTNTIHLDTQQIRLQSRTFNLFARDSVSIRSGMTGASSTALRQDATTGLSLAEYLPTSEWDWDGGAIDWRAKTVEISVLNSLVQITAFDPLAPIPTVSRQIEVSSEAISLRSYDAGVATPIYELRINALGVFVNEANLAMLPAATAQAQTAVTTLSTAVAPLDGRIAALEAIVVQQQSAIAALTTRINALEVI